MRKYIHKFKNYTSVEVDNLHDLKEGDLALYEDKFVTRNNGKVEEVVKGSGSSSEDEYSTDYPDDFIALLLDGTKFKYQIRNDSYIGSNKVNAIELDISNIDLDSIKIKGEIVTPLYTSNLYNETLPNDFLFLTGKITNSKLRIGTSFELRRNNFDTVYETFKITIFFKFKNKDSYYKFTVYNWKYDLNSETHSETNKFVYCKIGVPDFVNQVKSYTYNINDILIG